MKTSCIQLTNSSHLQEIYADLAKILELDLYFDQMSVSLMRSAFMLACQSYLKRDMHLLACLRCWGSGSLVSPAPLANRHNSTALQSKRSFAGPPIVYHEVHVSRLLSPSHVLSYPSIECASAISCLGYSWKLMWVSSIVQAYSAPQLPAGHRFPMVRPCTAPWSSQSFSHEA